MNVASPPEAVVEIQGLNTRFGSAVVHEDVSFSVRRGEIFALVGASGCGKSTLLREAIVLQPPVSGSIRVFGREVIGLSDDEALPLRRRWGVMFERGALFTALTVTENVGMVLHEHSALPPRLIRKSRRSRSRSPACRPTRAPSTRASSRAACASARHWLAPWRSTPSCCSSTSRPRASIR